MKRISFAVAALASGCLRVFAPDVGAQRANDAGAATDAIDGTIAPCSNAPTNPSFAVSFATDLHNGVLARGRCLNCHTGDGIGIVQSGLDLSSYMSLRTGGGRSAASIVIDGMPCASIIYQKIGPSPPFGRRMPYDGPPYLADGDILLVHDWIAQGALDN